MDDDVKGRYLRRLGLSETLSRRFLESGEVTELALVSSDLFFLDGTDVTVLMRLRHADTAVQRLRDFGLVDMKEGITEKPLPAGRSTPLERVSPAEADAYRTYVDEYSRYWRQYFDPIAMRLDDAPSGALELTTFILPLLDSALYAQVRGFVAPRNGAAAALRVPVVEPQPVLMLSLNLTNDAWGKASGGFSQIFSQYTGIDGALFDLLGPGLHVALQDGDPIIVLGNADLLGSFSGPMVGGDLTAGGAIPLLLALLTRPCKIIVQLQDEKAAVDMLRRTRTGPMMMQREMGLGADFRQVEGRDAWIYSLNVPGIVKIRFGIEVKNGYLVLSNIPWSQPVTIKTVDVPTLNGADLQISPGAVRQGLPGLFAAHSEQSQLASIGGIAALYPLLASGYADDAIMVQVIIVSGAGTLQDAARARAFCAFDYVPKPFDSGYLVSRVEAALHVDFEGTER